MRTVFFVLVSSFSLSMFGAIANPASTSVAAAAASPEPIAQSTAIPQESLQPVASVDDEHKLICQHPVHDGTVLPQQICLTKRHWEMIRVREQNKFRDYLMHDN